MSGETSFEVVFGIKAVTDSATQLTAIEVPGGNAQGVLIKAPGPTDDDPNTLSVFLGNQHVTADQGGRGGMPLAPGESITLPITTASRLYVIAADTNQKLNWILM